MRSARSAAPAWPLQLLLLSRRLATASARNPVLALNLLLAIVFLLVYDGSLGGSTAVLALVGGNYVNHILPAAVLAASVAGGAAGIALVADLDSRYFHRLLTMPLSRAAIVLALVGIGALHVALQATAIVAAALLMGADPATGAAGLATIVLLALTWGLGFAGYSTVVAILTRNAQVTAAAGFLFVPLVFMSPLLLPLDQLKPWVQAVAQVNPANYVMLGMRSLLTDGWEWHQLAPAFAAAAGFATVTISIAVVLIRRSIR